MGKELLEMIKMNTDVILLACLLLLVVLMCIEVQKTRKMQKSLAYLTDKLAQYLKVVLEEPQMDEPVLETEEEPLISKQELQMRASIQKQKDQKIQGQIGLMDAVLSEIFP